MSKVEDLSVGSVLLGTALPVIFLILVAGDGDVPQSIFAKTFIMAVLLFLAFVLVLFKTQHQHLYGAIETITAIVGAWQAMSNFGNDQGVNALALFGAIYLMTRGVANMYAPAPNKESKTAT